MRRRAVLVVGAMVALVVGLGAGAAYGYFTTTGHGSGATSIGTAAAVTLEATSGTVASYLQPGSNADLLVEIDNLNSYAVTLTGISENGTTVTPVGGTGCTSANATVSVSSQTNLSITVPSGTTVVHVPGGASMGTAASNGCQGTSFQIPVLITVQKG
jgi:hypothetical protein